MSDDEMTIAEAKAVLRQQWEQGLDCPCCSQRVQLYNFGLSGGIALSLIKLYKLDKAQPAYYHVKEFDSWHDDYAGGTFAKSRYWGFAVDQDNSDTTKRTSGMWAITAKGREFVEGTITVQSHVKLFNKKSYGFKGDFINIKQALGKRFDYAELMGNTQSTEPEQGSLL